VKFLNNDFKACSLSHALDYMCHIVKYWWRNLFKTKFKYKHWRVFGLKWSKGGWTLVYLILQLVCTEYYICNIPICCY